MNVFSKGIKIIPRFDTTSVFGSVEEANTWMEENKVQFKYWDYNTTIKTKQGWVVTNKFDPRCNDKVSPVKAGFRVEV